MNIAPKSSFVLHQRHLLGIESPSRDEIAGQIGRIPVPPLGLYVSNARNAAQGA